MTGSTIAELSGSGGTPPFGRRASVRRLRAAPAQTLQHRTGESIVDPERALRPVVRAQHKIVESNPRAFHTVAGSRSVLGRPHERLAGLFREVVERDRFSGRPHRTLERLWMAVEGLAIGTENHRSVEHGQDLL